MELLQSAVIVFFLGVAPVASAQQMRIDIVGGHEAKAGEFPFMVSLRQDGGHFCGGTLVAAQWVLTAAHCAQATDFSQVTLVLGTNKASGPGGETKRAKRVVVHPHYDPSRIENDFALIELNSESKMRPAVLDSHEISIPDQESKAPIATIAGWGLTRERGDLPANLRTAQIPLVSAARCKAALADFAPITDEMICAGRDRGGVDTCQGDSGGPLLTQTVNGSYLLSGVTSFGEGCGEAGKFGVYAKVSSAAAWIQETIR